MHQIAEHAEGPEDERLPPALAIATARRHTGLLRALTASGYDAESLARVQRAYELARRLVAGLHNGDGRPFIDHLVSLASLLHHYGQPPVVVTAGFLHSIYAHGDFGALCSFRRARAQLRRAVGPEVEAHAAQFHRLAWNRRGIEAHLRDIARYDPIDRACLVMRLANEVDHLIDDAALYRGDGPRYVTARFERVPQYRALAEALAVPTIADDFERLLANVRTRSVPAPLREAVATPFRIVSGSYRRTAVATILQRVAALVPRTGRVGALRARLWPRRG